MAQPEIGGTDKGRAVMIFGSTGEKWVAALIDLAGHLKVDVITVPLPDDAATETTLADALTALQKIDDLQKALGSVAEDLLRVESKSGDKLYSFESIVEGILVDPDLPAGDKNVDDDPVDSGKMWKITTVSIRYDGTVPTEIDAIARNLAGHIVIIQKMAPVSTQWYIYSGEMYMQEGDFIRARVVGGTEHDTLFCRYTGLQMNVP